MSDRTDTDSSDEVMALRGVVTRGIGESACFTEIPWVKKQFNQKLSIDPYPGTFNITVIAEDLEKLARLRESRGIEISPEDENFCAASSFPVLINRQIKGAVIIPLVADYPASKLEVISEEHIKDSLSLQDGDQVEVEVYL